MKNKSALQTEYKSERSNVVYKMIW